MPETPRPPVVVLGAGYAGVALVHELHRRTRGRVEVTVVDRHASHTLRTRLYEVGRLAEADGRPDRWSVPIDQVLSHDRARFVTGEIQAIDLVRRSVRVEGTEIPYSALAVCLGNVAAYYGIPGAAEHTEQVYRFQGAVQLAGRLKELVRPRAAAASNPVRVIVVGGGSTGTEVAAEIATTNWSQVVGTAARPVEVTLVVGSVPFLAGLPDPLVRHAETLLRKASVRSIPGLNVARVDPGLLTLQDGQRLEADVVVWCAGLSAPALVRDLPVPHGKGGRIRVGPTLEVAGQPGMFAVGDSAELKDPQTGMLVPGTAQAAMAEAPVAARNIAAFLAGKPLEAFRYREHGMVVEVGRGRGSGKVAGLTVWGRPAALVKAAVDGEYAAARRLGRDPPGL